MPHAFSVVRVLHGVVARISRNHSEALRDSVSRHLTISVARFRRPPDPPGQGPRWWQLDRGRWNPGWRTRSWNPPGGIIWISGPRRLHLGSRRAHRATEANRTTWCRRQQPTRIRPQDGLTEHVLIEAHPLHIPQRIPCHPPPHLRHVPPVPRRIPVPPRTPQVRIVPVPRVPHAALHTHRTQHAAAKRLVPPRDAVGMRRIARIDHAVKVGIRADLVGHAAPPPAPPSMSPAARHPTSVPHAGNKWGGLSSLPSSMASHRHRWGGFPNPPRGVRQQLNRSAHVPRPSPPTPNPETCGLSGPRSATNPTAPKSSKKALATYPRATVNRATTGS
jgi:hypothetical protein